MSSERLQLSQAILALLAVLPIIASVNAGCVTRQFARPIPFPSTSSAIQTQPTPRININSASAEELEKLPGIGKALAARIVEHREKYGPFRKPEHLIIVRGISEKRFRELKDLITVE